MPARDPVLRRTASLLALCTALGACFVLGRWSVDAVGGTSPAAVAAALGGGGATGKAYRARRVRSYSGRLHFGGERLPRYQPYATPNTSCARWCVFTTINPPTRAVKQCAALRGWCVVVVGDKKSPPAYELSKARNQTHVVYLGPAAQEALPYRIVKLLPWNHFGRKNIGYVYAVHHGARVVLDIDDDNELLPAATTHGGLNPRLSLLGHKLGVVRNETATPLHLKLVPAAAAAARGPATAPRVFNPYPHFRPAREGELARPDDEADAAAAANRHPAWPRGFPLDSVLDEATRPTPLPASKPGVAREWARAQSHHAAVPLAASAAAAAAAGRGAAAGPVPGGASPAGLSSPAALSIGALQLLADHDPDVDAIFRLSRRLPVAFGERRDVLALPAGVMAPMNAQALLVARAALWGLLLPVSVHGRVSDIWRSYAWQRLLWGCELRVAFSAPLVKQVLLPPPTRLPPLAFISPHCVPMHPPSLAPRRAARLAPQVRNVHSYLADLNAEVPLYERSGALIALLLRTTLRAAHLPGQAEELVIAMYEHGILEIEDVRLTQAFLADLIAAGYEFPPLRRNVTLHAPA